MSSISDLLAGTGKIPSFFTRDTPVGTAVVGTIVDAQVRQSRNFETGDPEFWADGNPKEQVAIILQTDLRDPMNPEDDGRRGVYVKWWGEARQALAAAIKAAGDTDIRVGGMFRAQYVGEKPTEGNTRLSPTKIHAYQYQKPAQTAGLDMAGQVPAAAAPPAQAAPQGFAQSPGAPPAFAQAAPQGFAQSPGAPPAFAQAAPPAAAQGVPAAFNQLGASPLGADGFPPPAAAAPAQNGVDFAAMAAQQAAPAPAAAAPTGVDEGKALQFLALGLTDEDIAAALGTTPPVIAAIRARG